MPVIDISVISAYLQFHSQLYLYRLSKDSSSNARCFADCLDRTPTHFRNLNTTDSKDCSSKEKLEVA